MKKKLRSAFLLESLEARLLFSADMAPMPVDGGNPGAEVESGLEISLRPDNGGMQAAETIRQEDREVIFVDEAVDEYQQLIDNIESQLEKGRQFDIVALDSDSDGIAQISAYLSQQQDVAAVHLISHGADGEVFLGNSRLNATTLEGYAEAIEGWQRALSSDADLLFYGCNLAAGHDGQELVNSLTLLTGADVAASNDVTGSAQFGGNWVLEYGKGEIETASAINPETHQNWRGVLATFIVNTTADTIDVNLGDGNAEDAAGNTSLRAAIMEANALGGTNTINFDIPLDDLKHYYFKDDSSGNSLSLVAVTDLDDASITDFDPDYPGTPYSWFSIKPSSILPAITDPVIIDASTQPGYAGKPIIELDGTDVSGSDPNGLTIQGGNSTVRGLVINRFQGTDADAIEIEINGGNTIAGNYIGTDVTGTQQKGNRWGINLKSADNMVGGKNAADRNVISGNINEGFYIYTATATGNFLSGNYIGVDATGSAPLGNGSHGVYITNSASNTTIVGNIISGNTGHGIAIDNDDGGNIIEGNLIGTDVDGLVDLGNTLNGVDINDSANNRIGGKTPGAGNLISGNDDWGIHLDRGGATGNNIFGNLIGTDAKGTGGIGNLSGGVKVKGSATDNLIGGHFPGEGNIIAFNVGEGVNISSGTNRIRTNIIFDNGGATFDITLTGGNTNADMPSVSGAISGGGTTDVTVSLSGADANQSYRVDLFSNPTNEAEGQVYLGTVVLTTDGSGNASQLFTLNNEVPNGYYITATASNAISGTSAFCTMTIVSGPLSVNTAPVLDPTINVTLNPYLENAGPPVGSVGTLIKDLVDLQGGGGQDNVFDPDVAALPGIAVISTDTSNGTWHYSTDNGTNWFALGAVSIDSARLLAADDASTRIYFQPNPSFSGSIPEAIYFRAWDQSDVNANGAAGVDTTIHGGTTAFSLMFASASSVTVTHGPIILSGTSVAEMAANGTSVGFAAVLDELSTGGDFLGSGTPPSYTTYSSGQTFSSWTVTSGQVDLLGSSYDASPQGGNSVDLGGGVGLGGQPGTISQMLTTVAGQQYEVTFALSGMWPFVATPTMDLRVGFGGDSQDISIDKPTGWSQTDFKWTQQTLTFTAMSSSTDLSFASLEPDGEGPIVGDVAVIGPSVAGYTYALMDDANGRFDIHPTTGELTVADGSLLDYETATSHDITVRASLGASVIGDESFTIQVTDINDAPLGVPTITGTVAEDQTLTADTTGISDADGLGAFTYQWLRNGVVIGGATAGTYVLGDADVGTQISVQVNYSDGHGTAEGPLISLPTAAVANVNDAPLGVPTITGTVAEDQTLTADTTGISDADGLGAFTYQWLRNGVVIGGATAGTYVLGDADVGTQISVQVNYSDGHGTAEGPLISLPTAAVANVNDAPLGVPTITGTVAEDQTLTADTTGISDADGLGAFTYQWLRNGVVIGGATAGTYVLGDADVGTQISVQVNYSDGHGTAEGPLISLPTAAVANVNDAPLGVPTITGTVAEDQTLTADTTGISDADGLGAFTYQWLRNGVVIGGATAGTYVLGDADVGTQISVQVNYSDGHGTAEGPLISLPTAAVANVNDAPLGVPTITGTVAEDQTLTADTTGISDADGLGAFTYQWLRNGVVIGGATAGTYVLGDADVGTQISVQVNYSDGHGTAEGPLISLPTAAVANVNDAPLGVPTITGTVAEDQTLTADTTGISDADGLGAFTYQWLRNGVVIGGATAGTYVLGDADVGTQISVQVNYSDGHGTAEGPLISLPTAAVANVNDAPLGVPTITGTVAEDQTLTADTTGISDADGLGAFTYQWLRNGVVIGGATAGTYVLGDADVGTQISVQVNYSDGHGTAEGPLISLPTAAVANVNDAPLGVPTITGTVAEDQTLTADTTGISDADGLGAFTYQWLRNGVVIGGATAGTYVLGDADVGTQISVQVNYSDGHGTAEGPLISLPTAAVANVNDAPLGVPTITGTVAEDQTLTADTTGISDADGLGAFTYQWLRNGVVIGGATAGTYVLGDADVGTQISVQVNYSDGHGTAEGPLISLPTAAVANVNETPVAVNDNLHATEDQSITFTSVTDLLGNDSDIDGDTLTISGFTQPANGMLANNGDGTFTYTPIANFYGNDSFTYTITDGNGETAIGTAIIVVAPVGDTPQVTSASAISEALSELIFINRNPSDGAEVTHFKISGITNGALYLADGVTRIENGDYIIVEQGQAGLRFIPAAGSTADGSFNVESSEDGVSVAPQSGIATSNITILTTAPPPSASEQSPPPSEPEQVASEEVVPEESEVVEDDADEPDVQADAGNLDPVEPLQSSKVPGIAKAPLGHGLSFLRRADFDSNDDQTPDRSILLSPQTLKTLLEAEDLGELKAALKKLGITTLSPADYELVRNSLDAIKEEIDRETLIGRTVLGSAIATSIGLSAGYVVWMLKGGSLLASVLSSLPAWQLADPLAILVGKKDDEDDEDDSLKTIIAEGSGRDKGKKSRASELDNVKKESEKR